MSEELGQLLRDGGSGPLAIDIRHEGDYEEWHIPGSLDIDDELAELELGPNNCAAE